MAHALLLYACLSISFWCEAVAESVYIFNRLPTNTEKGYMAPITAAYDIEVDLSHEHIFGCKCYMQLPQAKREKGFTDKAVVCTYLGHRADGSPGYTVLNRSSNKIEFSSDLTFDETDLLDNILKEPSSDENQLKVSDVSRDIDDFKWLEGMCCLDENQLFITSRAVVERGLIVAYRCLIVNNERGAEEVYPLHVADVERLVNNYSSTEKVMVECVSANNKSEFLTINSEKSEGTDDIAGPDEGRPFDGRMDSESSGGVSTAVGNRPEGVPNSEVNLYHHRGHHGQRTVH